MEQSKQRPASQPMIVKYMETASNGVQSHTFSRNVVGYVLRGTKYIYEGDQRTAIEKNNVFFLDVGNHYMEDLPDEDGHPFEQIIFYYSPYDLHKIIINLNVSYGFSISNNHSCETCRTHRYVGMEAWSAIRNLFVNINAYLREGQSIRDTTIENIKLTELIYLIASHEDCCLKSKVLSNIDTGKENFEQIVYSHIFTVINIEEMAQKCNKSLTAFKKEFRRVFEMPPHKWFVRQRLMHSRLLLVSTSKAISEIGNECAFPNTSHFIKLFKKVYKLTPAAYRSLHHKDKQMAETMKSQAVTKPINSKSGKKEAVV